jgi:hypothetical protein
MKQTKWALYVLLTYLFFGCGPHSQAMLQEEGAPVTAAPACEPEPVLYLSTRPAISGRRVVVTTWQIVSASGFTLFFTLVFDRETNTPDRPVYALQARSGHEARDNQESAEEWVSLQLRPLSPLSLGTPAYGRSPSSRTSSRTIFPPSPPLLVRQQACAVEYYPTRQGFTPDSTNTTPSFTVRHVDEDSSLGDDLSLAEEDLQEEDLEDAILPDLLGP